MSRLSTRALVAVLLLVAGVSNGSRAASGAPPKFKSGVFDPPRAAPAFELAGSNGSPLKLTQFRGKVVILQFGFTYCPKICPVTLTNVTQAFELLGKESADVQHIFVTVDPARDTPERLREYLSFFNPNFLGATGPEEKLQAVNDEYGVVATKASSPDKQLRYEVHHTSSIYLIDRAGMLRVMVPFGKEPKAIVHDIKLLLEK